MSARIDVTAPPSYLAEFSEPAGFLNFAGVGPPSRRAVDATTSFLHLLQEPDASLGARFTETLDASRRAVATFLGTRFELAGLAFSTGDALFQVAMGLRGGNVVVPAAEFPANLYPWIRAQEFGRVDEVRFLDVPDGRVTPARVAALVDDRTVAVALSLVDFATGFVVDVEGMRAAAPNALLVVDAIQGLGALSIRLDAADVVVAGGQKWLRAGMGIALLSVSERALERLAPTLVGWLGVSDPFDFVAPHPRPALPDAGRFRVSAPPVVGATALTAALGLIEEAGLGMLHATILQKVKQVEEIVRSKGGEVLTPWQRDEERAGILSFRFPGLSSAETVGRLAGAGVVISERKGWIRASPHATTSPETLEMLAAAL